MMTQSEQLESKINDVCVVIECVQICVETTFVVILTGILLKRGWLKLMPFRMKLTMVIFWIQNLFVFSIMVYFVVIKRDWVSKQDHNTAMKIYAAEFLLTNSIHWTFIFHYFATARLFDILFQ